MKAQKSIAGWFRILLPGQTIPGNWGKKVGTVNLRNRNTIN